MSRRSIPRYSAMKVKGGSAYMKEERDLQSTLPKTKELKIPERSLSRGSYRPRRGNY